MAAVLVVVYWWLKGFRLRVIGDAKPLLRSCEIYLSDPWLLRVGFQYPYCTALQFVDIRTWLVFQILLWSLTVVFIYRVGANLFDEPTGLIAGVAMALTWETFRFALRPQTDAMLLFVLSVAFWALARDRRVSSRRSQVLVAGTLLLSLVTRPAGIPVVFGWLAWKASGSLDDLSLNPAEMSRKTVVMLTSLVALALFTTYRYFVPRLARPAPEPGIYWRKGLAGAWWNGIVVTHTKAPTFQYLYQPETASSMISWMVLNGDHLFVMALLRMAAFFIPVLPRWSTLHIVVNAITIFPLVVGTALGTYRLLTNGQRRIAGFLLAPVLGTLLTVAIIYVDGGFNYRAPATLSFALLTAYWVRDTLAETGLDDRIQRLVSLPSVTSR